MEYTIKIDDHGTLISPQPTKEELYIALMGIEQSILNLSSDKRKAYEDILIITEGVLFEEV